MSGYQGYPGEIGNSNPNFALVDSDFVRGAPKQVANTTALYALSSSPDLLKQYVTVVYVLDLAYEMRLVDITNAGNSAGWVASSITTDATPQSGSTKAVQSGGVYTALAGKQASLGYTPENLANKNVASGYAGLDSGGKIPTSLLPGNSAGAVIYKGTYDGSIVTSDDSTLNGNPLPTAATANAGYYFIATATFTYNSEEYNPKDFIISDGSAGWSKIDNTDSVSSVFGRVGNVIANVSDYASVYPQLGGSYNDPTWITNLAWSKIASTPTTIAGYGITDGVTLTGVQTLTNKSIVATQLTGTLQAAQAPAFTGDVTTTAGSLVTTLATVTPAKGGTGTTTVFTAGSVVYAGASGVYSQDNSNFYYNATSHNLSVTTGGDLTGTNAVNVYGQYDAYMPQSSIGTITSGTTLPGITASTSRGNGTSPAINNTGDLIGSHSFWAYTGTTPAYTYMAGMAGSAVGTTAANLGGQLDFYVKANNGGLASALTIDNTSTVKVNAGNFSVTNTTPTLSFITSSDSAIATISRTTTANTLSFSNTILQQGGIGNAVIFNGSTQYFTGDDSNHPTGTSITLTIAGWIKGPLSVPGTMYAYGVTDGSGNPALRFDFTQPSNARFYLFNGSTQIAALGTSILTSTWNHYVLTISGSTVSVYVNGTLSQTVTASAYNISSLAGATGVTNKPPGAANPLSTYDQLLVYNTVLTGTQILALYNSGSGTSTLPTTTGLIRQFNFDEGSGSSVGDSNPNVTQKPLTLVNYAVSQWVGIGNGIVPTTNSTTTMSLLKSVDGINANERGQALIGDVQSGTRLQGISVKHFINNKVPFIADFTGNVLISPANTSESAASLSPLGVTGLAVGSYATSNAAPTNGMIVSGPSIFGGVSDNGTDKLQVIGTGYASTNFNSPIIKGLSTTPQFILQTSADSAQAIISRSVTSNTITYTNPVLQQSGKGNALQMIGTSFATASDTGLGSGTSMSQTICFWLKSSAGSGNAVISYGPVGNQLIISLYQGLTLTCTSIGNNNYTTGSIPFNQWNFCAVVLQGSNATLYLNGATQTTASYSYNVTLNGVFTISSANNVSIDQLLIYNTNLNTTQLSAIYNTGAGVSNPSTTNLIRRYDFEEGTGATVSDSNPNGTQYNLTLTNSPKWLGVGNGIVPISGSSQTGTYLKYSDGVFANEKGTLKVSDPFSGTYIQGFTVKKFINGSLIPEITDNFGNTLVSSTNTSESARSLSALGVIDGVAIGSYATTVVAPTNGLIVSGPVGFGTSSPSSSYVYDANGDTRTTGVVNIVSSTPEQHFVTSADSAFARFQRAISANTFTGKNQVLQVGGIGRAIAFNGTSYGQGSDTGLPSGSPTLTISLWIKYGTGVAGNLQGGTLLSYGGAGSSGISILVRFNGPILVGDGSGANVNILPTVVVPISTTAWTHIVVAISGVSATAYINNVSTSGTLSFTPNIVLAGANGLTIGTTRQCPFVYDQMLIYNRILSTTSGTAGANEISQLYNSGAGTATIPTGAIRRYEFEEGTGSTTSDVNVVGTQYPISFINAPVWQAVGIVPISSASSETTFFSIRDGISNAEKGITTWGDFTGRNMQQGKWFQWFQGSSYPLVSNNTGQWRFDPNNITSTVPTILSTIDLAGNLTIGSTAAGTIAAPTDGLYVQGQTTHLGVTNFLTYGNALASTPEMRWTTSSDSAFARLQRTTITSNNLFLGKNNVLQVGGVGRALKFTSATNQNFSVTDAGLPTSTSTSLVMSVSFWYKSIASGSHPIFQYGTGSSSFGVFVGTNIIGITNGGSTISTPGVTLQNGVWRHLVLTFNGATATLYVDGSFASAMSTPPTVALSGTFTNGLMNNAAAYGNYNIDQLLIYNTTLPATGTGTSVVTLYNGGAGTATPPPIGLIRRYEFEEGVGTTTADINALGTQYPLTLNNYLASQWVPVGIVPISASSTETTFFQVSDGLTNAEKGIATWGDFTGRNMQQGKWFQWFQGINYPLVSNNTGQWLFDPNNTSGTLPTISATVTIAGSSTAAGSAPLKLLAGTLMTTAEAQAIEATTGHIYWTDGNGVRYQLDRQASAVVDIITATQQAVVNNKYIADYATLCTITLPTNANSNIGDQVIIRGRGAGGWKLAQNASDFIHGASDTTTGTAGYIASQTRYDCLSVEKIGANEWTVINKQGTLTIN